MRLNCIHYVYKQQQKKTLHNQPFARLQILIENAARCFYCLVGNAHFRRLATIQPMWIDWNSNCCRVNICLSTQRYITWVTNWITMNPIRLMPSNLFHNLHLCTQHSSLTINILFFSHSINHNCKKDASTNVHFCVHCCCCCCCCALGILFGILFDVWMSCVWVCVCLWLFLFLLSLRLSVLHT